MPTIPYVRQTWTDGVSQYTAARGAVQENGIFEVSYAPAVRVYHNAAQSITSATPTALAFNSERFDQAGNAADTMHDNVTNNSRLTCRYAGVYQITGNASFAANATGYRQLEIKLNNTTTIESSIDMTASGTVASRILCTTLYSLAVNDYVELIAYQTSGGGLNVDVIGNLSPEFMMVRVG
jgi:hypothetical protein